MIDDIALNKASIVRRCLKRIDEEFQGDPQRLDNFTVQDSVILNLLRACEAAIDLGMHIVADRKLGIPQSSGDAFTLLERSSIISSECAVALKKMTGFRNFAVHNYQEVEVPILLSILRSHLGDFGEFLRQIESLPPSDSPEGE